MSTPRATSERLQKILSAAGVASRREAERLISSGRVTVNGRPVERLGERADPAVDVIAIDGERIRPTAGPRTIVLHKPRGVVSTLRDPQGRPTVADLVRRAATRVYPVGRLDLQTSGVLLLTSDGALAANLQHPRTAVPRVYHVKVRGTPSPQTRARMRRGLRLEDGMAVATRVRLLEALPTKSWIEIVLREGRWREVRRMCEAVGHPVEKLCRVRLGPIRLGALPRGAWRECTPTELRALYRVAGLKEPPALAPAGRERAARRTRRRTSAGSRRGGQRPVSSRS